MTDKNDDLACLLDSDVHRAYLCYGTETRSKHTHDGNIDNSITLLALALWCFSPRPLVPGRWLSVVGRHDEGVWPINIARSVAFAYTALHLRPHVGGVLRYRPPPIDPDHDVIVVHGQQSSLPQHEQWSHTCVFLP
jgi:hypothetical protein